MKNQTNILINPQAQILGFFVVHLKADIETGN